jgi:hypothetical protein
VRNNARQKAMDKFDKQIADEKKKQEKKWKSLDI